MLVLKNVMLNFPNIIKPQDPMEEGGKPKYNACIMIPKEDTETIKAIEELVEKTIAENGATFGGKKTGIKKPLRDGDERVLDYPEFEGYMFFNCSTVRKPKVFDMDKVKLTEEEMEEEIYSGQIINVSVNAFAYAYQASKGVSISLNNIQVVGGGTLLYDDQAGEEF